GARAAAGTLPRETARGPGAGRGIALVGGGLAVAEGYGGRRPSVEAHGGRRAADAPLEPEGFVDRHVGGAVGGFGHQQAPASILVRHAPSIARVRREPLTVRARGT